MRCTLFFPRGSQSSDCLGVQVHGYEFIRQTKKVVKKTLEQCHHGKGGPLMGIPLHGISHTIRNDTNTLSALSMLPDPSDSQRGIAQPPRLGPGLRLGLHLVTRLSLIIAIKADQNQQVRPKSFVDVALDKVTWFYSWPTSSAVVDGVPVLGGPLGGPPILGGGGNGDDFRLGTPSNSLLFCSCSLK
jgi:hypothetical protein